MEHKGKNRYAPDTVFPPGRTLEETLETTGMSRFEFAERMGITTKYVNNIILDACVGVYNEELAEDEQVDFKGKAKAF
ncbi:MAG: hypothetical protein R6T92_06985 [Desulfosalsimonadaceae bacterium]